MVKIGRCSCDDILKDPEDAAAIVLGYERKVAPYHSNIRRRPSANSTSLTKSGAKLLKRLMSALLTNRPSGLVVSNSSSISFPAAFAMSATTSAIEVVSSVFFRDSHARQARVRW